MMPGGEGATIGRRGEVECVETVNRRRVMEERNIEVQGLE